MPEAQAIEEQFRRKRLPGSPEELHRALMAEGDLAAGEMDVPVEWLTRLAEQGRARYIEPGLWIAEEEAALYADALKPAMKKRCAASCADACVIGADRTRRDWISAIWRERIVLLRRWMRCKKEGRAVCRDGIYYHEQIYTRGAAGYA